LSAEQAKELREIEENGSLFDLIEAWLERTPFLKFRDFHFMEQYKMAVDSMIAKEKTAIQNTSMLNERERKMRLTMLEGTDNYFRTVLDPDFHRQQREEGHVRLSYKAMVAALLINLYREEPILRDPYNFLTRIMDIDEYLTTWRYRHAQMVLRMLGKKVGTGGSSGHAYLSATAAKHHIFKDFHNISTLLIPRSELPQLPDHLKKELGFYFTEKRN
jgi:tryptophan 2,3-dioxygenase